MPGFNPNFYHKGKTPSHTKAFFSESNILTVQSIILTNILLLMYKYHNLKQCIPQSVADIISPLAPYSDTSQCNDKKWFANHSTGKYRNSLCFKGPLFITNIYLTFRPISRTRTLQMSQLYPQNILKIMQSRSC